MELTRVQMHYEVPKKLKTFLEEVLESQIKYLKNKNAKDEVKYENLTITEDFFDVLNRFSADVGNQFQKVAFTEGIERIIKQAEECLHSTSADCLELLVYDFLKKLYDHTNQLEKQLYVNILFDSYFQKLHEQLPDLTENIFGSLLKKILPYVKLELLHNNFKKGITPSKFSLEEFIECILFPRLLRESCYQIVFNKIGSKNYEFIRFEMIPLVEGKGYIGEYFKIKIEIKHNNINQVLNCFAKYITKKNSILEKLALQAFKKEEFVYLKLMPLLKIHGIEELSNFAPQCYLSIHNEVIILQDMSLLGFTYTELNVPKDYDWTVMVIKQLSRFHACSIILDEKLSQKTGSEIRVGDIFKEFLNDTFFDKNTPTGQLMYLGAKLISEYFIDKLPDICKKMSVEEFKEKASIESENAFEREKRSDKFYNVINHGDLWCGNVLSNAEMEGVIIDYQLIKYCPPQLDLLFVLYCNTDRQFRLRYMNDIIDIYYNEMKQNLSLYNVDIQKVFQRNEFLTAIDYFRSTAIVKALAYLQILLIPNNILSEVENDEEKYNKFYYSDRKELYDSVWSHQPLRSRIRGLIEDLFDICELK